VKEDRSWPTAVFRRHEVVAVESARANDSNTNRPSMVLAGSAEPHKAVLTRCELLGRNQHEPDGVSAHVVAVDPANSLIHLVFELRKKSIAATHVN